MTPPDASYNADHITVLKGLEPVRRRPGMYIGGTDTKGYHHLLWEIVDNSVDEVINGFATHIEVILHKDHRSVTVTDNGRGIPVDIKKEFKKSALELVLTVLHAGGKFSSGQYQYSGGLHGVGSSVVNALSEEMVARVKRDGFEWEQRYARGEVTSKLDQDRRGTWYRHVHLLSSRPADLRQAGFFGRNHSFSPGNQDLSAQGPEDHLPRRAAGTSEALQHDGGIADFLTKMSPIGARRRPRRRISTFSAKTKTACASRAALQWTESHEETLRSYVNGIPTTQGGSHEQGCARPSSRPCARSSTPRGSRPRIVNLTAEDIREGIVGVLSIYLHEPQFQGQTKERLGNPEARRLVDSAIRPALETFLLENRTAGATIVERIVLAAKAREASRAASQAVSRKTAISHRLNLPGKLADCSSTDPAKSELFIVEGDSAGGSAKQGRERRYQAILPLRGKVLNAEQASLQKVLSNKELQDVVSALGCGVGEAFQRWSGCATTRSSS
jgi:DNA gyrase subunit B